MNWMAKHEPNWFRQVPNTPATPEVIVAFILETPIWRFYSFLDILNPKETVGGRNQDAAYSAPPPVQ